MGTVADCKFRTLCYLGKKKCQEWPVCFSSTFLRSFPPVLPNRK